MRRVSLILAAGGMILTAGADAQQYPKALANMADAQGRPVGTVELTQYPGGVLVRADLSGLPGGWHGFHVHETGRCDPPTFESAGKHFDSGSHKHGFDQEGRHAGDLPNIHVGADGKSMVEHLADRIRIEDSAAATSIALAAVGSATMPANILDQDGASVVVHAKPDDYRSDPAGNSGDRIACGVVEKAQRR